MFVHASELAAAFSCVDPAALLAPEELTGGKSSDGDKWACSALETLQCDQQQHPANNNKYSDTWLDARSTNTTSTPTGRIYNNKQ